MKRILPIIIVIVLIVSMAVPVSADTYGNGAYGAMADYLLGDPAVKGYEELDMMPVGNVQQYLYDNIDDTSIVSFKSSSYKTALSDSVTNGYTSSFAYIANKPYNTDSKIIMECYAGSRTNLDFYLTSGYFYVLNNSNGINSITHYQFTFTYNTTSHKWTCTNGSRTSNINVWTWTPKSNGTPVYGGGSLIYTVPSMTLRGTQSTTGTVTGLVPAGSSSDYWGQSYKTKFRLGTTITNDGIHNNKITVTTTDTTSEWRVTRILCDYNKLVSDLNDLSLPAPGGTGFAVSGGNGPSAQAVRDSLTQLGIDALNTDFGSVSSDIATSPLPGYLVNGYLSQVNSLKVGSVDSTYPDIETVIGQQATAFINQYIFNVNEYATSALSSGTFDMSPYTSTRVRGSGTVSYYLDVSHPVEDNLDPTVLYQNYAKWLDKSLKLLACYFVYDSNNQLVSVLTSGIDLIQSFDDFREPDPIGTVDFGDDEPVNYVPPEDIGYAEEEFTLYDHALYMRDILNSFESNLFLRLDSMRNAYTVSNTYNTYNNQSYSISGNVEQEIQDQMQEQMLTALVPSYDFQFSVPSDVVNGMSLTAKLFDNVLDNTDMRSIILTVVSLGLIAWFVFGRKG